MSSLAPHVMKEHVHSCSASSESAREHRLPANATSMPPRGPRPPIELILNDAIARLPAGFGPAEMRRIAQILAARR